MTILHCHSKRGQGSNQIEQVRSVPVARSAPMSGGGPGAVSAPAGVAERRASGSYTSHRQPNLMYNVRSEPWPQKGAEGKAQSHSRGELISYSGGNTANGASIQPNQSRRTSLKNGIVSQRRLDIVGGCECTAGGSNGAPGPATNPPDRRSDTNNTPVSSLQGRVHPLQQPQGGLMRHPADRVLVCWTFRATAANSLNGSIFGR